MMPEPDTNCPYGDESDIEARYLAGSLSPAESEVFEEHYFCCDRCFAAVQRGNEISAALGATSGTVSTRVDSASHITGRRRFAAWQPALAAAAVVVVALGIRQVAESRAVTRTAAANSAAETSRGGAPALSLTPHSTRTALVAVWSSAPAARSYRVRLLGADGSLLFERETSDTSIILSRDLLPGPDDKRIAYWEAQALDALRSVVATSSVVPAQTSANLP